VYPIIGSGDHGVKAQGDGWLLTVALVEGINLAAVDSSGSSDPYVVFTCNGKTRTSSIKFQKSDPQWNGECYFLLHWCIVLVFTIISYYDVNYTIVGSNLFRSLSKYNLNLIVFLLLTMLHFAEIFEFDAMDELPSVMDVEVYDFDGPFDEATSLGHAEINFLKSNISDLADVWVPLQGKLAQACQSKIHLRIFLNNTRGGNVVKEYLSKMEKEVGKKVNGQFCFGKFIIAYVLLLLLFKPCAWLFYFSY
jgi:hypothetical protein